MKIRKFLLGLSTLIYGATVGAAFWTEKAEAQSSPRPYVVFVNGQGDCCAHKMVNLQNRLLTEIKGLTQNDIRLVPYYNFDEQGGLRSGLTDRTDEPFLRDGANFINNQLDKNRPLVLIGHSYGGDSILKLLPRINRRIQFVAVIDPVSTGGFREPLTRDLGIGSNVDYFFNRWQENEPFPNDYSNDGSISCSARTCDQAEQPFYTRADGSTVTERCDSWETCRTKNAQTGHQGLPTDNWIERIIGDRISEVLASLSASSPQLTAADLCWYQHKGWQDGSVSWTSKNCKKVGSRWNFRTVFASSNGVIYGINANNELLWYQHVGWQDGSANWASGMGTKVGNGWRFRTVFASSDGVIYGINANHELLWYKHNGWQDGSRRWASVTGKKVGRGWSFRTVFASSNGVIYGINSNNELCWYKHNGWQDGSTSWASKNCTKVGTGWDFTTVFASNNGAIYGVKPNGDLYWYRHDGWQDGSNRWANGGIGIKVGSKWNFQSVFATSDGSIYGIMR